MTAEFSRDNEFWFSTLIRDLNDTLAAEHQIGALKWAESVNQEKVDRMIQDFQDDLETRDPEIILAGAARYKAKMRKIYAAYKVHLLKKERAKILGGNDGG